MYNVIYIQCFPTAEYMYVSSIYFHTAKNDAPHLHIC